jgi:excisionase family DNA binding protein
MKGETKDSVTRLTYSVEEACLLLGLSRNTTYEAIRRGELRAIRIGRRLLVPRASIDRILRDVHEEVSK